MNKWIGLEWSIQPDAWELFWYIRLQLQLVCFKCKISIYVWLSVWMSNHNSWTLDLLVSNFVGELGSAGKRREYLSVTWTTWVPKLVFFYKYNSKFDYKCALSFKEIVIFERANFESNKWEHSNFRWSSIFRTVYPIHKSTLANLCLIKDI